MFRRTLFALVAALGLGVAAYAVAQEDPRAAGDNYPVDMCPVMNVKIDSKGSPVVKQIEGRTVKVCCARCAGAFEKDPEKFHKKLDAMIVAKTKAKYPLKTCVVGDEELGSMCAPIEYVHRPANRLVRFCCEGCVETFKKEPEKYLAKLDEAASAK